MAFIDRWIQRRREIWKLIVETWNSPYKGCFTKGACIETIRDNMMSVSANGGYVNGEERPVDHPDKGIAAKHFIYDISNFDVRQTIEWAIEEGLLEKDVTDGNVSYKLK